MNSTQDDREQVIAQYIGQFPSESLLQLAKTEDQKKYWGHLAAFYLAVSKYWQAEIQGDDPLIEGVKNKKLNRWYYDAICARVDLLQNLWRLIDSGYQYIFEAAIKAGYDNYSFIGAPDLFCHIVETQADNTFRLCLKPFHNVSTPARLKAWKILSKAIKNRTTIPHHEYNFIKSLASQYKHNLWLLFSLVVIRDAAAGNQELLLKLDSYLNAVVEDFKVTATGLSRKRSSNTFEKFYSFTWYNGKIVPVNTTGGTYSLS